MDPIVTSIITGIGINYFTQYSAPVIENFFKKVFKLKPSLKSQLCEAKSVKDIEKFFEDAMKVINLHAGSGSIDIDGSFLEAIRGIRFDHEHGNVTIANTTLSSNVLFTGGSFGSTGMTQINGETEMKSSGTTIKVGKGCSIRITGNAGIIQS